MTARRFFNDDVILGVQLFAVGPELANDLRGTLKALAEAGYSVVETAGLYGRTAAEFRAELDAFGLRCVSMHVPGMRLSRPTPTLRDDLEQVAADALALGASQIVMPMFLLPTRAGPLPAEGIVPFVRAAGAALQPADYASMADFLNERGQALARHGLHLGYHNHGVEFLPQGESNGLALLIDATDPDLVSFELDIGWAVATNTDPEALILSYPGRFNQLHLKDVKEGDAGGEFVSVELGQGRVDLPTVLDAAHRSGVRHYFIEQEAPFHRPRLDAMAANLAYAREITIGAAA